MPGGAWIIPLILRFDLENDWVDRLTTRFSREVCWFGPRARLGARSPRQAELVLQDRQEHPGRDVVGRLAGGEPIVGIAANPRISSPPLPIANVATEPNSSVTAWASLPCLSITNVARPITSYRSDVSPEPDSPALR